MAKLNVPPTKSNLLALKRQLDFAQEGYDLLDQKRQILILELLSRLDRASKAQKRLAEALDQAYAALRDALLDVGSMGVDAAILAVGTNPEAEVTLQSLMGLRLGHVIAQEVNPGAPFGVSGTSANLDLALQRFSAVLPLIAEVAELENAVLRLARELRKTQRRCNALSKIVIPAQRETISYISAALEEREREFLSVLKMIRQRLGRG